MESQFYNQDCLVGFSGLLAFLLVLFVPKSEEAEKITTSSSVNRWLGS